MDKLTPLKPLPSLCALGATLIIWFLIPVPEGVAPNAWQLLALFIGTIIAIIGKAMPIGAVSVIAIALVAVTGVTNPGKPGAALDDALSGFSNQLIWLIGFSIMISLSLNKTGLGARIGYYFISLFGKKTLGIAYALTLAETTLAPVTPSNTARGGGIIHPIMKSIADSFGSKPELNTSGKIGRYLSLVNYNINPVTSAMFITATAPNPLIVSLIAKGTHGSFELSWSMWAVAALVPGLCSLIVMPLVIYLLYPPEVKSTPDAPRFAREKLQALGPVTLPEKITLGVFALLLVLWAGIPAMIFGPALAVNPTTAALIGLAVLLATGVLSWEDVLKHKGAWDTVVWFSALVMMASFLGKLGLIGWLSQTVGNGIDRMGMSWVGGTILLTLIYLYSHYFFASTTAHVTAMFAAFFAAGIALGAPPALLGLILAFSSSLMMSLTHYGTGTAPIIFGSGYVTLGEWWKAGWVMSVINLLIWIVIGGAWWKLLGYW
ncbi:DASS family sodium-coupled anion symporter [Serratia marcescens]|jgi:DASS family divalent anion:Na+ symporter|uniref:DASS family sodium-coupled anion symporter n=2 Tax=Serratia marcescens TaxID=615 RepID=UPI000A18E37B|nr:DASS family sodium-coupled anion symporter [Serratia marcescens]MBH3056228.1 DASS family sodium-coupled anion symporter [Serratia marcescens]MBH3301327.1 DASS family sodium-coupled anion symporter [Serratia marcescens]MDX7538957.1 DASS family sodium-coupled anion symporter [Serratia marcescens]HAX9724712.1 DASS family sodium-coupled anion symporter [Serratia marcescens]HBK4605813.1 DASS family sodium-coupled anion symporter [Serratia marcescens]